MHCNLRPPDAEPVIFCFNWNAHAKFEVGQVIRFWLLALFNFIYLLCKLYQGTRKIVQKSIKREKTYKKTDDALRYAVTLIFDPVTLTFDFWPWSFLVYVSFDIIKLCTKFERSRAIRGIVIAIFNIWLNDLEHVNVCGTSCITWSKSVRNLSEIEQSPADLL